MTIDNKLKAKYGALTEFPNKGTRSIEDLFTRLACGDLSLKNYIIFISQPAELFKTIEKADESLEECKTQISKLFHEDGMTFYDVIAIINENMDIMDTPIYTFGMYLKIQIIIKSGNIKTVNDFITAVEDKEKLKLLLSERNIGPALIKKITFKIKDYLEIGEISYTEILNNKKVLISNERKKIMDGSIDELIERAKEYYDDFNLESKEKLLEEVRVKINTELENIHIKKRN